MPLSLAFESFCVNVRRIVAAELAIVDCWPWRSAGVRDSQAGQAGPAVVRVRFPAFSSSASVPAFTFVSIISSSCCPPWRCWPGLAAGCFGTWLAGWFWFGARHGGRRPAASAAPAWPAKAGRPKAQSPSTQPAHACRLRPLAAYDVRAIVRGGGRERMDPRAIFLQLAAAAGLPHDVPKQSVRGGPMIAEYFKAHTGG